MAAVISRWLNGQLIKNNRKDCLNNKSCIAYSDKQKADFSVGFLFIGIFFI